MGDVDAILAEVRSLATRGEHHLIVARYGRLDDAPADELWNSTELLYEVGRAFGMLGNEDKVERYLLRCAELSPRRAAVFHCAIGWYFQRKKKWTKALRWYDRALESFPTVPPLSVPPRLLSREAASPARSGRGARAGSRRVGSGRHPSSGYAAVASRSRCSSICRACLRDLGDFDAAAASLDACGAARRRVGPAHHPARAPARQPRRAAHAARRPRRRARSVFEQARDIDPDSSYLWERLGRVHELRGDIDDGRGGLPSRRLPPARRLRLPRARPSPHRGHPRPPRRGGGARRGAAAGSRAPSRWSASSSPASSSRCDRPHAALAQVEQALACRREGGFAEALRLAADLAERLGRACEGRRLPAQARRRSRPTTPTLQRPHRASRSARRRRARDDASTLRCHRASRSSPRPASTGRRTRPRDGRRRPLLRRQGLRLRALRRRPDDLLPRHAVRRTAPPASPPGPRVSLRRRPQPEEGEAAGRRRPPHDIAVRRASALVALRRPCDNRATWSPRPFCRCWSPCTTRWPRSGRCSNASGPCRSAKEVIVVDDGSSDGTAEVLDGVPGRDVPTPPTSGSSCVHHERNQGKGAAVRTAIVARHGRHRPHPGRRPRVRSARVPEAAPAHPRRSRRRRLRLALRRQPAPRPALLAHGGQPAAHDALQRVHQPEPHRHGDLLQGLPGRRPAPHPAPLEPLRPRAGAHRQGRPPALPHLRGADLATTGAPTARARRSAGRTPCRPSGRSCASRSCPTSGAPTPATPRCGGSRRCIATTASCGS